MESEELYYITDEEGNSYGSNMKLEEADEKAKQLKAENPATTFYVDMENDEEIISKKIY